MEYDNFFNIDNSKWIVNKSEKSIPESITRLLSLGDRFALPTNLKDRKEKMDVALSFVKNFEAASYKFPDRLIDKVRSLIVNSLSSNLFRSKHVRFLDAHIHKQYTKCKNFLKNNDDLLVTKADKGQVTVILDKNDYVNQMTNILKDGNTYKILRTNPLRKISNKVDSLIKSWFDNKIVDESTYKRMKCTNGNLPRCYGLPKIHKPGHPLRIIVSSVGSPLYELAKFLDDVLRGSLCRPASFIKDSWSFVRKMTGKVLVPDEIMVSLDVTSLFTNIPRELVMQAIDNRWNNIQKNTKLSLSQLKSAIDLVLSSTGFAFNGCYYEQIYGSPMGSPLSPILADMVMDDLEVHSLNKLDFTVHTFYRYVDDIFMVIPTVGLDSVLGSFNDYHPRLKFTYEIENNNTLSFLNASVIRTDGGTLITNWYRKPTFSGRYINFFSNHPYQYKLNTITNLVDQAILLSDKQFHTENLGTVKSILKNNGYPIKMVNKKINNRFNYLIRNKFNKTNEDNTIERSDNRMVSMNIPYFGNISEDIKRITRNIVEVRYTVPKKLDTLIKSGKDKLDLQRVTEIVYKINCKNCDRAYIGQTKRHLGTRIKEHKSNIKNSSGNFSVVSEHRLNFNHDFDWEKPIILHKERHRMKREIAEMFFIKKFDNNLNLQKDTENLNPIYDKIIVS